MSLSEALATGRSGSDIGYAGYFYQAATGLEFTLNRAYDPQHARWLNRDPIGEAGGINLYAYVGQDPMSFEDPLGLCGLDIVESADIIEAASIIVGGTIVAAPLEIGVAAAIGAVAIAYYGGEGLGLVINHFL